MKSGRRDLAPAAAELLPPGGSPRRPAATATSGSRLPLTQFVTWSHSLAAEILRPGDLAVDLTAGRGRDTFMLAEAVGRKGRVVAFDIQRQAVDQTLGILIRARPEATEWPLGRRIPGEPGVYVVHGCHTHLAAMLPEAPRVVMANLGYLPGGDHRLTTLPESTCTALHQALGLMVPGGRLVVIGYPAHVGGAEECTRVERVFAGLAEQDWEVLKMTAPNRPEAPFLIAADCRG